MLPALLLSTLISLPAFALDEEERTWPQLRDLTWMEKNYLSRQREFVDELAREKLGLQLRENQDDLTLLQRVINRGLIESSNSRKLQALGVVLGDQFVRDFNLEWRRYEDELGESTAACVKDTTHCLFPITMLSRRMEVGLMPNVEKIYTDASAMITPYLPKLPYSVQ
ncbi:hypothetical protein GCM10007877_35340 [Marinibactrum halimedae]|uniref:DUF3806 domain-containing protein n=1 Tax=Marinibactrum halimedae TaxID=1444977 RepID=A0AA37WNR2_9GAMM|nr:hypothetical protein GCM10007877_35340 [Marinibactrum halimedae]